MFSRNTLLNAIYHSIHRDYKGNIDGFKAVLVSRPNDGTCLVRLIDLYDHEISRLLDNRKAQVYLAARQS
jgi:hypothetical protein